MEVNRQSPEYIEKDAHSFVINIWFEQADAGEQTVLWRGRITHVASGQKAYLTHLNGIPEFIRTYLPNPGFWFVWRTRLQTYWWRITEE